MFLGVFCLKKTCRKPAKFTHCVLEIFSPLASKNVWKILVQIFIDSHPTLVDNFVEFRQKFFAFHFFRSRNRFEFRQTSFLPFLFFYALIAFCLTSQNFFLWLHPWFITKCQDFYQLSSFLTIMASSLSLSSTNKTSRFFTAFTVLLSTSAFFITITAPKTLLSSTTSLPTLITAKLLNLQKSASP